VNVTSWITLACAMPVLAGVGWQILRDLRKDRDEQEERAREAAVRDALVQERLRQLEERGHDDD